MKSEITPKDNLRILSWYIIDAYKSSLVKEKGSIQLYLKYDKEIIECYYKSDGNNLIFDFGEIPNYDVKLTSSLYDWLDLANDKINPVWGVMTKRLKFEGDIKVFDKLINKESIYKIDTNIFDPPTSFEINPIKKWKIPKKIMVIIGSPRGKNGYTYHYLNRFIKGLQGNGAYIEIIELGEKKINPCIGCFHCWKNNTGKCIQKDDVNDLYDIYMDSDLIIYGFTLYWDTIPGILKNFIERTFSLEHPYMIPGVRKTRHPRRTKKEQSLFIFSVCGFPEQSHFTPVKEYFKSVSHNAHIPLLGGIYRSACMFLLNDPGYYKIYNQVLNSIQKAGESLFFHGRIDNKILKTIHTKIDPKKFQIHSNKYWENVVLKKENFVKSV